MNRKLILRFSVACFATMVLGLVSCQDKDYYDPDLKPDSNGDPSLMDFSTSQDVKLNLTYADVPATFISVFDVYTENPMFGAITGQPHLRSDLTPIAGGIAVGGQIELNKTIPAGVKELYLYSPDLFIPPLFSATIENGVANFEEVDLSTLVTNEATTRTLGDNKVDGYLTKNYSVGQKPSVSISHRPDYIDRTGNVSSFLNTVTSAFPNGHKADQQYYEDALIYLHESAEVWVSVIHSDGSWNNALSYFCFNGTKQELANASKDQIKEIVAFPRAKLSSERNGLKNNEYVKLLYFDGINYVDKFPKNVTVGFVLRADGYDINNRNLKTPDGIYYSLNAWNPEPEGISKQHTIYFNAQTDKSKDPIVCFGFEDMSNEVRYKERVNIGTSWWPIWVTRDCAGDGDCNDVMFHVDINPITAIDPPPPVPVPGTRYHTESRKGTLAFEDNWPKKGDYDLNDVVVNYESKTTYIQATEDNIPVGPITLTSLEDKITLAHSGADYTNAFAYKLYISPSLVESITIDNVAYTPISDGDGFIIKISDDVATDVSSVKTGSEYDCTPKLFDVKVNFIENAITQEQFNNNKLYAPYNPYIIPDNKKGYEVHLAYYPPTNNADYELFNTEDDRSDKNKLWYVGEVDNPYPFAIHLFNVDGFKKIPRESLSIDKSYPEFEKWVSSKFGDFLQWYENPADY